VPVQLRVVDNTIGRCDPAVEAAVYFCALEAIQNAVKHAGHRARVTVTLERRGDTVRFSIDDDGVGFDPGADGDGLGLISMRDRLTAFGGELHVISSPGAGTSVRGTGPVEVEPLGRADVI
jgi:signal transduction histidine kinase